MFRRVSILIFGLLCALTLTAQDLSSIQVYGFATQGFLYSSHNNYLSMDSSSGSLQWTEGAINFSDSLTDNLRVGIQMHMYQLGEFGGPHLTVDWVSGDYKINDHLGFRAGKVKTAYGLFNESRMSTQFSSGRCCPSRSIRRTTRASISPISVANSTEMRALANEPVQLPIADTQAIATSKRTAATQRRSTTSRA